MQQTVTELIGRFGYWGVFFLIFIENIFPPIPSEVILLFGGALTLSTAMEVPGVVAAATFGSLAGAIALYALGRALGLERLKKLFAGRLGRILHFRPEQVDQAFGWFGRYQNRAVFICRCVPVVRSLISIPAGCNKMGLPLFLLLTALGSAVWNTVLAWLGALLGTAWERALPDHFDRVYPGTGGLPDLDGAGAQTPERIAKRLYKAPSPVR